MTAARVSHGAVAPTVLVIAPLLIMPIARIA